MTTIKRKPKIKPLPWKCMKCRERTVTKAVIENYRRERKYDGATYTFTVPKLEAYRCAKCGSIVLDDAANRQISDAFYQELGLLTPEAIRRNREALCLTQKQMAAHLGIAEATLSRWETGAQIQQRSLDRLMRAYFACPELRKAFADPGDLRLLGASVVEDGAPSSEANPNADQDLTARLAEAFGEIEKQTATALARHLQNIDTLKIIPSLVELLDFLISLGPDDRKHVVEWLQSSLRVFKTLSRKELQPKTG